MRIAGAYAMAGVADESSEPARRQQCVDVLCGYLRLPYDPEHGSSHRSELVTTTKREAEPPIASVEEQVHQRLRQNDREVGQTILRVIAAHLRREAETSWSPHDFDFTGVFFEDASFRGATFGGERTSFARATFAGEDTDFEQARFGGKYTSFDRPKAWENISFDWDRTRSPLTGGEGSPADMPQCIHPHEWPPKVAPEKTSPPT